MEQIKEGPGLDENKLNELGTDDSTEEEPISNTPEPDRAYLVCLGCGCYRQQTLWFDDGYLLLMCLACGNVSNLPLDPKLIPKEKIKKTKKKTLPSYFG